MTDLIRPVPGPETQDFAGAFPAERPGYLRTDVNPHQGKRTPFPGGKFRKDLHCGIDYSCPVGTKVKAMAAGRIVAQGIDPSSGNAWFVNQRVHRGPNFDLLIVYYHLRANGLLYKIGDTVAQGQPIALSGNTGWSSAPHLHVQLARVPRGAAPNAWYAGTFLDPQPFIDGHAYFVNVD